MIPINHVQIKVINRNSLVFLDILRSTLVLVFMVIIITYPGSDTCIPKSRVVL